jgi:circadian clock protein KaiC
MSDDDNSRVPGRVPSGVPGLDAILHGGFFRGGVYMLLAGPGSGKTILGSQIAFRHVAAGGRALFVTLLTESHSRLLGFLKNLEFFDPSCVGASLSYVTGYQVLEKDKLKGLLGFLRKIVRDHKATLLVIDGFIMAGASGTSELEGKKFVHELQVFAELAGCTTLLLTGASRKGDEYALRTMVDGLVELRHDPFGMEQARTIEVSKFRGGGILTGRHLFEITDAGLTIHPRTESRFGKTLPHVDRALVPPATFDVDGLDEMLGGGLRSGSLTMLLGTPGSGKTLLGLSFLTAGAQAKERGLYFGFFETPADLCRKSDAIGLALTRNTKRGAIELEWHSPLDAIADALADRLVDSIRRRGIRRLFIDGLGGFRESLVYAERSSRFFRALCDELRSLGVVTVLSDEVLTAGKLDAPEPGLTAMLDNLLILRHVEDGVHLRQFVSVIKTRDAIGDSSPREYSIGPHGFVVVPASASADHTPASPTRGRPARRRRAAEPKKASSGRRR